MINLKKIESSENITDLDTLVEEVNEMIDFYKDLEKDGGKMVVWFGWPDLATFLLISQATVLG